MVNPWDGIYIEVLDYQRALAEIDPDMAVNMEHEDASYSRVEGPALAAGNLRAAAEKI